MATADTPAASSEQPETQSRLIDETYHSAIETIQTDDNRVVIKRSHHPDDPRTLVRFENEVNILKSVTDSIHISQILDSNAIRLTITLRFEHGQSLDRFVNDKMRSTLSASDSITVWKQISSALAYLHSRSIIHDDVKPDNIMWSSEREHSVLIDFGAALVDVPEGSFTPSGTPNYVAPEFLHKVKSAKGDIWALGITMLFAFDYIALPDGEWVLPAVWDEPSDARNEMLLWLSEIEKLRGRLSNDKPLLVSMLEKDPEARMCSLDLSQALEASSIGELKRDRVK